MRNPGCNTEFNAGLSNSLPNGAQILARFQCVESKWIVLCSWRKGTADTYTGKREYVTWDVSEQGDAFSGHYYPDYDTAAQDYQWRIGRAMGTNG